MPPRDDHSASLGSSYHLIDLIGEGAMGAVWRAMDRRSGEYVAAKLLHGRLIDDPDIVARFVQERTVLLRLRHPGIVAIRDFVLEGGRIAIVMDLVDGTDLDRYLREAGTLDPVRAAGIIIQLGEALAAAHAAGVVHRDVKPGNVLMSRPAPGAPETVKLTDFGVSRILQDQAAAAATAIVGTPSYMAPEVIEGSAPAPAGDVYALGMVLYELLAGRAPFACGNNLSPLHSAFHMAPRRLVGMPEDLWTVIAACTAKDPAVRPTMQQIVAWLRAALPRLEGLVALPPVPRSAPLSATAVPLERPMTPGPALVPGPAPAPGPAPVPGPAPASSIPPIPGPAPASSIPPAPGPAPLSAPQAEEGSRPRTRGLIMAGLSIAAAIAVTAGAFSVVEFGPAQEVAASAPVDTPGTRSPEQTATPSPRTDAVPTPVVASTDPIRKSGDRAERHTPSPQVSTDSRRTSLSDSTATSDGRNSSADSGTSSPKPRRTPDKARSTPKKSPNIVDYHAPSRPDTLKCRPEWATVPGQGFAMRPCIRVRDGKLAVIGQVRGNKGTAVDVEVQLWDVKAREGASQPFVCTNLRFTADGQVKSCGYFQVPSPLSGEYQSRQRWRKPGTPDFQGGAQSTSVIW